MSRRERIATLAQASRLVIASLAAGIALVGFGVISVRLARGVTSWILTGASTIAAGLLGVAVRDLRRLSKPGVGKPKSKKG